MIVVTGASGKLGSQVIVHLLKLIPPAQIIASVREPVEARNLLEKDVAVRKGDYGDPEELAWSFDGANRLLLISASGTDFESRALQHRNAIDAAARAGVEHIFYTSLLPPEGSVAYVCKAHLDTEKALKESGLAYTILKNSCYSEAWNLYVGQPVGSEVLIPADGPVSWVSRSDLAEGTARLLLSHGHAGETLSLTGPGSMDIKDVTQILSKVRGQPLSRRIVPLEDYIAHEVESGKRPEVARHWATTYFGMALGEFGRIDPFLAALLGRPLRTFEETVGGASPERIET